MVIILDDEDRENEGDFIMAAEHATPEAVAFTDPRTPAASSACRWRTSACEQLDLPQMVNQQRRRVSHGVHRHCRLPARHQHWRVCGFDRSVTIRALAERWPHMPADFARPGPHLPPCAPGAAACSFARGHTEAAGGLCASSQASKPAGVLCELMNDDGTMSRRAEIEVFAKQHNLKIGTIADLIRYRLRNERSVERVAEQAVQTDFGEFRMYTYEDRVHKGTHTALVHGQLDGPEPPLVRVHVADTQRGPTRRSRPDSHAPGRCAPAMERIAKRRQLASQSILQDAEASEIRQPRYGPSRGIGAGGQVLRTFGVGAQILKDLGVCRRCACCRRRSRCTASRRSVWKSRVTLAKGHERSEGHSGRVARRRAGVWWSSLRGSTSSLFPAS